MVTKENNPERICSFYASDYHLEMIMIPYINRKINEEANVNIITEKNLKDTVEVVVSRINIPKEKKEKILNINWKNKKISDVNQTNNDKESIFFVIGNTNYIKSVDSQIEKMELNTNTKIINCFSIDDVKEKMPEIVSYHSKVLNTTEEKEIL